MRSAQDLLDELNAVDESTRTEAKRTRQLGKSVLETVIAYTSEPGLNGGYPLLGVNRSVNDKGCTTYAPTGLLLSDNIRPDSTNVATLLATLCPKLATYECRPAVSIIRPPAQQKATSHMFILMLNDQLHLTYKKAKPNKQGGIHHGN